MLTHRDRGKRVAVIAGRQRGARGVLVNVLEYVGRRHAWVKLESGGDDLFPEERLELLEAGLASPPASTAAPLRRTG